MPKNKKPARKAPPPPAPDRTDELIEDLAVLAAEVVEEAGAGAGASAPLRKIDELQKMIRNALRKKQDEVLYGAIEHASYDNPGAYVLLRGEIEEAAAAIVLRAENKPLEEIDAFLVPVFVNSVGGVRRAETFADPAGFELLRASFQAAGLESAAATVVLISHLYDIDEIDALSYCEVNEMLREVAATMGGKSAPMPILQRSIAADETPHAPGDEVTELRFLLGFVRRRVDDPAYAIPDDEAGSEAWFDARMEKYRAWTAMADGLLRACIAADPGRVTLNFLFQNQFFAAKRQAMAEAELLSLMAELGELFDAHELEPEQCSAVVGPVAREADIALRVALYRNGDAAPLASVELPYDLGDDLDEAIEALCDILHNLGMASLSTADGFAADGQPEQLAPWTAE